MHPMVCAPPASATARASLRRGAQVRNLYKRIIIAGRDYPAGLDYVRQKAKAEFAKRAHIRDDVEARATPLAAILRVQRRVVAVRLSHAALRLLDGKVPM